MPVWETIIGMHPVDHQPLRSGRRSGCSCGSTPGPCRDAKALRTASASSDGLNGFMRRMLLSAGSPDVSASARASPEMKMMGAPGQSSRNRSTSSFPPIPGITTSEIRRSTGPGASPEIEKIAANPSSSSTTENPRSRSARATTRLTKGSSSTTITVWSESGKSPVRTGSAGVYPSTIQLGHPQSARGPGDGRSRAAHCHPQVWTSTAP